MDDCTWISGERHTCCEVARWYKKGRGVPPVGRQWSLAAVRRPVCPRESRSAFEDNPADKLGISMHAVLMIVRGKRDEGRWSLAPSPVGYPLGPAAGARGDLDRGKSRMKRLDGAPIARVRWLAVSRQETGAEVFLGYAGAGPGPPPRAGHSLAHRRAAQPGRLRGGVAAPSRRAEGGLIVREERINGRHTAFDVRCRSEVYAAVARHGGQVVGPGAAGSHRVFLAGEAPGLLIVTRTEFFDEALSMGINTATLYCRDTRWGDRVIDDLNTIYKAHARAVEAKLAAVERPQTATEPRRTRRRRTRRAPRRDGP